MAKMTPQRFRRSSFFSLFCVFLSAVVLSSSSCDSCTAFLIQSSTTTRNLVTTTTQPITREGIIAKKTFPSSTSSPFSSSSSTSSSSSSVLSRQRRSVASIQTFGIFGLGAGELIVIALVGIVLIGPASIKDAAKSTGKAASGISEEWKSVPKEFQKGFEEGEIEYRSRNAKPMESLPSELKENQEKNT